MLKQHVGLNNGVVQMSRLLVGVFAFLLTTVLSAPAAWASEFRGMSKAKLLCAGGTLLFLASSPAFAQVTTLNGGDALNPTPAGISATQGPNEGTVYPSTNNVRNSLIVSGPVNKGEAVPRINLDSLPPGVFTLIQPGDRLDR